MSTGYIDSTDYYQKNTKSYFDTTVKIDMSSMHDIFLPLIPKGGKILDAGSGSGRDVKVFLDKGFQVAAFDATKNMAKVASEYTGIAVAHRTFTDVDEIEEYDGIWSSASLLHVHEQELINAMQNLKSALKKGGVWYMSFREGMEQTIEEGRYFNNQNEDSLRSLIDAVGGLEILELTIPNHIRSPSGPRFVIAIVRKIA